MTLLFKKHASNEDWTHDLWFTRPTLCHWAIEAPAEWLPLSVQQDTIGRSKVNRGHTDLNHGPIGLQPIALPLSYIPSLTRHCKIPDMLKLILTEESSIGGSWHLCQSPSGSGWRGLTCTALPITCAIFMWRSMPYLKNLTHALKATKMFSFYHSIIWNCF